MFVLLLILIVTLVGLGFLHPFWWLAATVLVFAAVRHGRDHGGDSSSVEFRDYKERRDRQERWNRRYSRQNRARWEREDRRDRERRG
ncbi:hypothetical protein [Streptomyces collinus]|uniref:hypothetical protein n=1 Tax=Streptomyces collinus TaxID=42684 RepID=UPI00343DBE5D